MGRVWWGGEGVSVWGCGGEGWRGGGECVGVWWRGLEGRG